MLVLRRRAGESLLIGDDIEVEFLAVTGQGAKIGIRAPRETVILRKELKVTQQQNEAAARALAIPDLHRVIKKLEKFEKLHAGTHEPLFRPDKHK